MSNGTDRRRRRSHGEWSVIVERCSRSGLDARTFCAREQLGYATFRRWRSRLLDRTPTPSVAAASSSSSNPFIDLGAMGSAVSEALEVELELGAGVVVRLKRG